jgi:peptidoglycan/LPS O-acetylase OafA/YrhL
MDVITSAEIIFLAQACAVIAIVAIVTAFIEGPATRWYQRWHYFKDLDWRQVPPPNYRCSRGGREYW